MKWLKWLEDYFDRWSFFYKTVLVLSLIFWAPGIAVFMAGSSVRDLSTWEVADTQGGHDIDVARENGLELVKFTGRLTKKAVEEGEGYTIEEYFEDKKTLDIKVASFRGEIHPYSLPRRMMMNLRMASQEVLSRQIQQFPGRHRQACQTYDIWRGKSAPGDSAESQEAVLLVFLSWLLGAWAKALPLVVMLYFVCMSKRSGIAETILAGKAKFVLAVIAWPFFVANYPNNELKEIVVEAELRRMGDLFRKLSARERKLVGKVAQLGIWDLAKWLVVFRRQNRVAPQRGYALALVATFFLLVLAPSLTAATSIKGRDGPRKEAAVHACKAIEGFSVEIEDEDDNEGPGSCSALVPKILAPEPNFLAKPVIPRVTNWLQELIEEVEHVPIFSCG